MALAEEGWIAETGQIDSSYIKAHRSAGGAKGGADLLIGETIAMKRLNAARGYDANRIRAALRE